nr:cupin domain-containing protein [Streptomyces sp. SID3343]
MFGNRDDCVRLSVPGIQAGPVAETKTVSKGWGEERWLVPEAAPWGFKLIHIKAGHRTSLQYHHHKEEACLVLSGEAHLHHAASPDDEPTQVLTGPGDVIHLAPGHVHRFEAVTDMTMVEISTPHLDDVVRIADDFARGDGRIAAEHEEARP